MAEDNLKVSLDEYNLQLNQVTTAIQLSGNGEDIQELLQLKEDLIELIKLTEESLLSLHKSNLLGMVEEAGTKEKPSDLENEMKTFYSEISTSEKSKNDQTFGEMGENEDSEMAKFYAELESENLGLEKKSNNTNVRFLRAKTNNTLKQVPSSSKVAEKANYQDILEETFEIDPLNEEFLDSIEYLEDISGVKCQAPYVTEWSGTQYHNAMIKGPIENEESRNGDILIRVLFLNPVLPSMRPCPYYLEGNCRFDESKCKFCHGHKISLYDLRPYVDPDYRLLEEGANCLAKFTDDIWKPGVVEKILENHTYEIRFLHENVNLEVDIKDLLPQISHLKQEDVLSSESDEDAIQPDGHHGPPTLSSPVSSALGAWEAHTKGVASKLMEKMGYKIGQGLGKRSQGRVEPVPIILLPPGKSLDHCMQIREKKGVKNMVDTSIKTSDATVKMLDKKQRGTRRKRGNCVFSFLNKTLGDKGVKASQVGHTSIPRDMFGIKEGKERKNTKKYHKEIFRNEEEMKKMEMKVKRLKESIKRNNEKNPSVAKVMRAKLRDLEEKLGSMKELGSKIKLDQKRMETHRKMTLF